MRSSRPVVALVTANLLALVPAALLGWSWGHHQLTADPIRYVQLRTGLYTLILLVVTLSCTPLYNLTGWRWLLTFRRVFGLYTFGYAAFHFFNFIGIDYSFNFPLLWKDVAKKRYVIVGFVAFLMLLALAVSSIPGWRQRFGRAWPWVRVLLYPAAILAVVHYYWQLKLGYEGPLIAAVIVFILLVLRLPPVAAAMQITPDGMRRGGRRPGR
jgi:sulfoxide reductase heme-binding subunit YedZ